MDPLEQLLAQYQIDPEQLKNQKRSALAMNVAAGLLGSRRGQEARGLGVGLLGGFNSAHQVQHDMLQQRQQDIAAASAMQKMNRDAGFDAEAMRLLSGGGPGTSAVSNNAAAPQSYGMNDRSAGEAPQMPQQQPTQQPPQQSMAGAPSWAQPNAELAMALSGRNHAADVIHRNMALTQGPNGTLMRNGVLVGQVTPQGVVMYENGDPSRGKFNANPQEAMQASAQAAGLTKGAETSAQEAAMNPYRVQEMRLPNGATQQVTGDQMQNFLRGGPGGLPMAGRTPAPADQAQDTDIAKGYGADFLDVVKAERAAPNNIGKYELMKNYLSNVNTGKAAPTVMNLKALASYVAPELTKEWTKDVPYAQAAESLSNEIALQLRNPAGGAGMPGALSNSDRDFLKSMTANIGQDPRAIAPMLDARIALEKRSQEIGKLAREYKAKTGRIDDGFYQQVQEYAEANPLFKDLKMPNAEAPAAKAPSVPVGTTGTHKSGRKVIMGEDGKWRFQ